MLYVLQVWIFVESWYVASPFLEVLEHIIALSQLCIFQVAAGELLYHAAAPGQASVVRL